MPSDAPAIEHGPGDNLEEWMVTWLRATDPGSSAVAGPSRLPASFDPLSPDAATVGALTEGADAAFAGYTNVLGLEEDEEEKPSATATTDNPGDLEAGNGPNAQETPTRLDRAKQLAVRAMHSTTAYNDLSQFDNAEFFEQLRRAPYTDENGTETTLLAAMSGAVQTLKQAFEVDPDDTDPDHETINKVKKYVTPFIDDVESSVNALQTDASSGKRLQMAAVSMALCVPPFLLGVYQEPRNFYYLATAAGAYAKTACQIYGMVNHPTSNSALQAQHIEYRHFVWLIPALLTYGPLVVATKIAEKADAKSAVDSLRSLQTGLPWAAGAGVVELGVFLGVNGRHGLSDFITRRRSTDAGQAARGELSLPSATAAQPDDPEAEADDPQTQELTQQAARAMFENAERQLALIRERRQEFEGDGNKISDNLSAQINFLAAAMQRLDKALGRVDGSAVPAADVPADQEVRGKLQQIQKLFTDLKEYAKNTLRDDATAKKSALALISVTLSTVSVVSVLNNPLALSDNAPFAALTIRAAVKGALDPSLTYQDMVRLFKDLSSGTLIATPASIANRINADAQFGKATGFVLWTTWLCISNLTLSGVSGEFTVRLLELLGKGGSDVIRMCRRMFPSGAPAPAGEAGLNPAEDDPQPPGSWPGTPGTEAIPLQEMRPRTGDDPGRAGGAGDPGSSAPAQAEAESSTAEPAAETGASEADIADAEERPMPGGFRP